MSQYCLVTGATSGIGAEFARSLAAEGRNLVLVARSESDLAEVAAKFTASYGVEIETLTADLSTTEGMELVEARLSSDVNPIEMLINNAGIGMDGTFLDNDSAAHHKMIEVNCAAVLRLSRAALEAMTKRNSGDIINVASVAAFTPGFRPAATYAASKAFVVALSEGLASSVARNSIRVSALCPGFVRTQFHDRAGIKMSKMPSFMWSSPEDVVSVALEDHRKGKSLIVPGRIYKVIVAVARLLPPKLVQKIAKVVGRRSR
jgi:uncharacterized protein